MRNILLLLLLVGAASPTRAQAQGGNNRVLEGRVLDPQGLPISGARVTVTEQPGGGRRTAVSSETFRLDGLAAAMYQVGIEAPGFASRTVSADLRNQPVTALEVRLDVAAFGAETIVSATRTEQRLGDVPVSATIIRGDEIRESPAVVADDVLRRLPTFSLFRRTSSLAAHPTAQGVSLRGIGPSGAGRTLVLLDDIPFNDPFGGWVYWTRVPLMNIDRIEMVDGSSSSVHGNYAMGGVINLVTAKPQRRTLILKPQYGGRKTERLGFPGSTVWDGLGGLDFFGSDVWGKFGAAVEGSYLKTNGYPEVAVTDPFNNGAVLRGPVDTKKTVNYQNLNVKLDYRHSERTNAFFRGGYFSEDRSNAKICTVVPSSLTSCEEANDTLWKSVSGGIRTRLADDSDLQARVFANFETFHSNFLAVPASVPSRSITRLTLLQKVPTKDAGFMVQWSKAVAGRHYFTVGTDWRRVDGDSNEDGFNATGTAITLKRISGGTQQSLGVFVQDLITVTSRLQLTLNARLDRWRNYDAHNLETDLITGLPTAANRATLPEKKNTVGTPRIAALYRVSESVSVWGSTSWGFRAPTLNELYRQFRVGTVLTLANENLGPERLFGGEVGVNVAPIRGLTWRNTYFVNRFTNPVSNVTLSTVGANITRQRQNVGKARVWGIQSDLEYRFMSWWRFGAGYIYDMARVRENATDPSLVGRFLAQVPKNRGSVQLAYSNPRHATIAIGAQFVGRQFDDDQNLLPLPGFGVVDLTASRAISSNTEAFFGIQNLLDRTFYVQRNPTTMGAPRLFTGGFRITLTGR